MSRSGGAASRSGSWPAQARSLGVALGAVLLFRSLVAEAFFIPSESMQPTLEVGDHVLVSKFAYGLRVPLLGWRLGATRPPQRGDVAVFVHPRTGEDLIKRVVAVAGDTVELRDGVLIVNGKAVPSKPLSVRCPLQLEGLGQVGCRACEERLEAKRYITWHWDRPTGDFAPLRVPEDSAFVLGDSRDNSNDSRYWGVVPYRKLKGRAERILWSYTWRGGLRCERTFTSLR